MTKPTSLLGDLAHSISVTEEKDMEEATHSHPCVLLHHSSFILSAAFTRAEGQNTVKKNIVKKEREHE